jgi:SAM-dependent methyltransferase
MSESPDSRYWDSVASSCASAAATSNPLWRTYSDALNGALVSRWVPGGATGRVLKTDLFDEVLGAGLYPLLRPRASTVVGIDLSPLMARRAQQAQGALLAVAADVRKLPFADQRFDLIVSDSTLDHFEHFDDLELALRELRRVLRSGGQLVLTLDNLANPIVAIRNALPYAWLRRIGLTPYFMGATCGPRRLRHVLAQAGFRVAAMDAVLHAPRLIAIPAARLALRYGSPKFQQRCVRALMGFESMARWPTRFVSAHFIAVSAFRA